MTLQALPTKTAARVLLGIGAAALALHVGVLAQLVPPHVVWGGRAAGSPSIVLLESIALALTAAFMAVVAMRVGVLRQRISTSTIARVFKGLTAFFVLNTVGNLLALSLLESCLFAPLTLVCALACYRLALAD